MAPLPAMLSLLVCFIVCFQCILGADNTKYKFVTPLTSMVVTKPDSTEKAVESVVEDADRRQASLKQRGYSMPGVARPSIRDYIVTFPSLDVSGIYSRELISVIGMKGKVNQAEAKKLPKPSKNTINRNTPEMFLSAIIVRLRNFTMCLAPKKIKPGNYELVKNRNGIKIKIEIAGAGKKCRDSVIRSVALETNGSTVTISVDPNNRWVHVARGNASITESTNRITVVGRKVELTIDRTQRKKQFNYVVDIKLSSIRGYRGFIRDLMRTKSKQLNWWEKGVPAICKDKSTVLSGSLNAKMLAAYKSVP